METNFNPDTDCLWIWGGYDYETRCGYSSPKAFDDCPGCDRTTYKIDMNDTEELNKIIKSISKHNDE